MGTQCVRIHNTNTGAILRATIPVGIHGACVHGATTVGGVPGSGARIDLDFSDTQGSVTGRLLPTGHLYETVEVAGEGEEPEHVQVTLLDAGQPTVFVTASSLGMPMEIRAAEIAGILERSPSLMRRVERLRGACAVLMGIVESWEDAERVSPYTPFVAILSPASDSSCDITSTVVFMQSVHKAYPVTGSVATLAAALLPGTLAHSVLSKGPCTGPLRIGHPTGVMEMEGLVEEEKLVKASITRTARRLMDGNAYVPWSTWPVECGHDMQCAACCHLFPRHHLFFFNRPKTFFKLKCGKPDSPRRTVAVVSCRLPNSSEDTALGEPVQSETFFTKYI